MVPSDLFRFVRRPVFLSHFPVKPFYVTKTKTAASEDDELTEGSLAAFVASWDAGELETKEFNLPARDGEEGAGDDESA